MTLLGSPVPAASQVIGRDEVVSNEQTYTTRAYPLGALHMDTGDGLPEGYIVLRLRSVAGGRAGPPTTWAEVRLPTRTPGETGWVARRALGAFTRVTAEFVVDRAADRMSLYRSGRLIFAAAVGIGRRSSPTPAGHFWIREGFPVAASARAAYGPYALGTSAYSVFPGWPGGGVVGIHGTSHPVVGQSTFGCVTMPDARILRLARLVPIGTPLWIR